MYKNLTKTQQERIKFIEENLQIFFNTKNKNPANMAEKFIKKYIHEAEVIQRVLTR